MRVVRSDPRKRRSGQTRGLYFVVKSGNGAPRDNHGTFFSNFQEDARDPSSWRGGLPDCRRKLPTAAPPLSPGSPPRRPHTPDTPPSRASVRDRPRPTQPARGRPPRRLGDQPHPTLRARVWVSPPAAAPPVARDMAWSEAPPSPRRRGGSVDGGSARCGAPPLLAPATVCRWTSSAAVRSGEGRRQRHRRLPCRGCRRCRARHRRDCNGWWCARPLAAAAATVGPWTTARRRRRRR